MKETIPDRIAKIVDVVTRGNLTAFGRIMSWTTQYTYKVTHNNSVGLSPIKEIVEAFPDINARWLLTGEGAMFTGQAERARARLIKLLELEAYMPVMSASQLRTLADNPEQITEEEIEELKTLLQAKEEALAQRFYESYEKSLTPAN